MVVFGDGKKVSGKRSERPAFGEIVGQAEFKQALLAAAANDAVDGLLVRGEKGTAKSTAVRALTDLLPRQRAVADCRYGCHPDETAQQCSECGRRSEPSVTERPVPLVTLPLGATRDRVAGTLSVGDALDGTKSFEPGLLARANRGILYVDEVNLLDDHLVDVLLDAAASGVNRVERDGVSVAHPSEFTLIGTMNPEEGDLRPQLRDRFALQTTVTACEDVDDRVAIIKQAVESGGAGRGDEGTEETDAYRRRLRGARERLADVTLPRERADQIATLCRDAGLDGHRGDIATARAARTLAALDARTTVIESDVRRAAELAIPHRLQSRPFEDAPAPEDVLDEHFDRDGGDGADEGATEDGSDGDSSSGTDQPATNGSIPDAEEPPAGADEPSTDADGPAPAAGGSDDAADGPDRSEEDGDASDGERPAPAGSGRDEPRTAEPDHSREDDADSEEATPVVPGQQRAGIGGGTAPDLQTPAAGEGGVASSGRARAPPSVGNDGPRVRTQQADGSERIDASASVRTAAQRGSDAVERRDLRQSVRAGEASTLVLFVVDASASMRPAMRAAKGTVMALLEDAYRERDRVGFVAVAGDGAEVVLPPTDSATHAARHLKDLPTGDRTPLPDGLRTAAEVIDRADPDGSVVVLVTDGRANVADGSPTAETRSAARSLAALDAQVLVVDAGEDDHTDVLGDVVAATDGRRVPLSALSAERVDAAAETASEV